MSDNRPIQCVSSVINEANRTASQKRQPVGICWNQTTTRWETYDLTVGTPHQPEFLCYGLGHTPHPLTEDAALSLDSLIRSRLLSRDSHSHH